MKIRILIIIILFFGKLYSQEKIELKNIFLEKGIAYNKLNNTIFTGIAQNKNKNGHIKFEKIYNNGKLIKTLLYYEINSEQMISDEKLYNPETSQKEKHTRFSSDGRKYWETKFDDHEKKYEFNFFENGNLILHEEYKNGKKDGKRLCFSKNGGKCEIVYKNGKELIHTDYFNGNNYWETKFDDYKKKTESNYYENGILIFRNKYKNGNKDGKWLSFNVDGSKCISEYSEGIKIKDCQ